MGQCVWLVRCNRENGHSDSGRKGKRTDLFKGQKSSERKKREKRREEDCVDEVKRRMRVNKKRGSLERHQEDLVVSGRVLTHVSHMVLPNCCGKRQ